jgi:hypothetical protein
MKPSPATYQGRQPWRELVDESLLIAFKEGLLMSNRTFEIAWSFFGRLKEVVGVEIFCQLCDARRNQHALYIHNYIPS